MAPLNAGGCSRAQTRTFCPHFKTILEHFAAFSSSGSTSRSKADRVDGELETLLSVPGMLFDFTPECCSACPGRRSQERENAAKCPRIVLKCWQNVRVCAREQPPALSGAIWNQHLARSERVFLQRTPKTANKTLHSGRLGPHRVFHPRSATRFDLPVRTSRPAVCQPPGGHAASYRHRRGSQSPGRHPRHWPSALRAAGNESLPRCRQ